VDEYSIGDFGHMIADRVRMDAYAAALRAAITPGCIVADIGAGTGILSFIACRAGAGHVHAIETNEEALEVARQAAAANGFADRITFHALPSTQVNLPQRADVIVSDLRGVLPWHAQHLKSIADARERLLAPGGKLIPQRDTLWVSCADAEETHASMFEPWALDGFDLRAACDIVANRWRKIGVAADKLVAPAAQAATLDYTTADSPDLSVRVELVAPRAATAHGIVAWFDTVLADGIGFSNAPGGDPLPVYGQAFFPWPQATTVAPGDAITVKLRADVVRGTYVWSWSTSIRDASGAAKADYAQSTFKGFPLSPHLMRSQQESYVPQVTDEARADLAALQSIAQGLPVGHIAELLMQEHPALFPDVKEALTRIGMLCARYRC
jgi:protein arginine N-methyltransferase 1